MFRVKKIKYLEKLLHILKNIYRHHVFACIWARKDHPLKNIINIIYLNLCLKQSIVINKTIDCFKHISFEVIHSNSVESPN